ncbi:MAG: TonB-dependent receptor, partial [Leadbetterella sp.]|nr:TonB-dependent receptor [Leadbetterella sp.]
VAGTYVLECSYVGYSTQKQEVTIGNTDVVFDFQLEGSSIDLAEVKIVATSQSGSELGSKQMERNALAVTNVIGARSIEISPDITVANVLQRVSGISLEKSAQGEGKYPVLRGMDKRYSYTLINGVKIPSPNDKNRYVPMDIFPADMIENIAVAKTLLPHMEGDAIGGAMNLIMKNAPAKTFANASLSLGYSTGLVQPDFRKFNSRDFARQSPARQYGSDYLSTPRDFSLKQFNYDQTRPLPDLNAMFSAGSRYLKNRLGIMIGASVQNNHRFNRSTYLMPSTTVNEGNQPTFEDALLRDYSTTLRRLGLHAKLDYQIDAHHRIELYSMYLNMAENQYRHTIDSVMKGRTSPGNGIVRIKDRSRIQSQSIYNSTLHGKHVLSPKFILDWKGVYSFAKNAIPGWAEFQTEYGIKNNEPIQTPVVIPFLSYVWQNNSDRDLTFMADITNKTNEWLELSAGGLYRNKHRKNYFNSYNLFPVREGTNPQYFESFEKSLFYFTPVESGYGNENSPNHYTAEEYTASGYFQFNLKLGQKLGVTGGVRYEQSQQSFETMVPETMDGKRGTIPYTDILPGLNLKYELSSNQDIRLSYFSSLSRPGFFEVIPYSIAGEDFMETGNPGLKQTRAKNFDVRYSYYPVGLDQVLVGAFYKDIDNPIEITYRSDPANPARGFMLSPNNFGSALNYGLELVITKYLGDFGVAGNYTFTSSRITTDKLYYDKVPGGTDNQLISIPQTRPLQGQSKHIANLSFLYKSMKNGINAQLAATYTGKRINEVSPFYELDYWQQPMTTLDFSIEKKIGNYFSLFAKFNNLLNTPMRVIIDKPNTGIAHLPRQESTQHFLVQEDFYGQSGLMGIRSKF